MVLDRGLLATWCWVSLFVLTGAGISLASGIPTFRGSDTGAIWSRDVMNMATLAFFQRDPVQAWRWHIDTFLAHRDARPNSSHMALAELEKRREMLVVTQNVDTLHEQSGSTRLIKVHGSMDRARCTRNGCVNGAPTGTIKILPASMAIYKDHLWVNDPLRCDADLTRFIDDPKFQTLPRCQVCRKLIRPHILWFDEYYNDHESYGMTRIREALDRATEVWFLGTSMAVGITDTVHTIARDRGLPMIYVNPSSEQAPDCARHIAAKVEEWLPDYVAGYRA